MARRKPESMKTRKLKFKSSVVNTPMPKGHSDQRLVRLRDVKAVKGQYLLMREHVLEIDKLRAELAKQCPNCGHPRPEPNSAAAFQVEAYIKALEKEVRRLRRNEH